MPSSRCSLPRGASPSSGSSPAPRGSRAPAAPRSTPRADDALTALREGLADGVAVDFAAGFGVDDPSADSSALLAEAVEVARGAHTVLLFLGLPPSYESEGYDRTHLDLPADQLAVLAAVREVNDRVVVVLANGSVVAVQRWEHLAGAILEGWLGGQAGGSAIADVILGRVSPSGRLAETMPLRLQDTPAYLNFPGEDRHVRYGEGIHVGYRYYDAVEREVSYPFGHGLSYTTFEYADLAVTALEASGDQHDHWMGPIRFSVSATVTNTGPVAGKEVVQLYVGARGSSVPRPVRELKGFAKVALAPGESQRVNLFLTERDLAYWSTRADGWVVEPGEVEVAVGASSRDLRLTEVVTVTGPPPTFPLDRSSTLKEWLEHPVGHELLLDVLAHSPSGDLTPMVDNPEQLRMLGSFPLPRLTAMLMPTREVGSDLVDGLLAQVDGRA
ncbi:glycoside hydrolase family 3 C-terminal domain-containing protein [Aquihabitans sp. G128]|nr:glycoside hydrolase family 3 C-terminal domain-containing protein [Aquihabitans sp. G128]QXC60031.1 glycoside hydrolase family 3 C-terminal domain-containing protein [Aquihabitans sp. G128]